MCSSYQEKAVKPIFFTRIDITLDRVNVYSKHSYCHLNLCYIFNLIFHSESLQILLHVHVLQFN